MNILFAVHAYKPAYRVGGPIHSVSALAEGIVRRGHRVTVFTSNSNLDETLDVPLNRPVDVNGVAVYYFRREEPLKKLVPFIPYFSKSMGFLYLPQMAPQLTKEINRTDVVHTHMPFVYPTYAAARAALTNKIPLYYHQRGVFDPERLRFRSWKKRLYIRYFEAPIMHRATTLIALTASEEASYRGLGISTPCKIIPNGIDVALYAHGNAARARAKWGIPSNATVLLFLGRIHPIKGADKLLEAFLSVASRFPDAILILAGPDEWGAQAKFAEDVAKCGLGSRVVFTGMVAGTEKSDLLAAADLFCLPSAGEGFSMAILEALASGTAVLISPGCHFPEVVSAGAGCIAGTKPEDITVALESLLQNKDVLRSMGTVGREFVLRNYRWDSIVDKTIEAYAEGIESKRK